jgi:uncharacterized protein (DUF302 family)
MTKNSEMIFVFLGLISANLANSAQTLAATLQESTSAKITHIRYTFDGKFDEYLSHFDAQLGKYNVTAYQALLKNPVENSEQVSKIIDSQAGSSGFMTFAVYDHGALINMTGVHQKAKQYVIGNPLIALSMTKHDVRAALYAPLRVLIYEDVSKKIQVEYDLPSSIFGQLHNANVDVVAKELDEKISALVEKANKDR